MATRNDDPFANLNLNPTGDESQVDPLLGVPAPQPDPNAPAPGDQATGPLSASTDDLNDDGNGANKITPARRSVWSWVVVAACVMAIMGLTADHFLGDKPAKKPAVATAQPGDGGLRPLQPMPPAPNGGKGGATARAPQPVEPPAETTPAPASPAGPNRQIADATHPVRVLGCKIKTFNENGLVPACDWFKASGELTPSMVSGFVNLHLEIRDEQGRILRSTPKPIRLFQTGDLGPVAFYATK